MVNYNQQDFNQATGSAMQTMLKKAPLMAYDITKWIFNFINQMISMVMGK